MNKWWKEIEKEKIIWELNTVVILIDEMNYYQDSRNIYKALT